MLKRGSLELKNFFNKVDVTDSIGLVIKKSRISNKKILKSLECPYLFLKIGRDTYPDDVLKKMVEAFRTKKWLIIYVKDTWFSGRIYGQLRLLSRLQWIQILNLRGEKDVLDMKLPEESRIILIMDKLTLDKFEIPNFLNLIGPIVEI